MKTIYKYINLLFLIVGGFNIALAQTVTNVRVQQEGDKIVITYDLDKDAYIGLDVIYGDELVSSVVNFFDYTTETKPKVEHLCAIWGKSQDVSGDVGRMKAGRNKRIVWDVLENSQEFVHEKVTFEVIPYSMYNGNKSFILAEYGYGFSPQHSAGITFGQCYRSTIGWYVSVRTNLSLKQDDGLSCGQGGYLEDGALPFYSGNTKNNHIMANVGILFDFLSIGVWPNYKSNMLALYAGVGYGQRYQLWETTDHQWITYQPTAYKGVSAECGLMASFKGFTLMAGVSTIDFKYMEVEAGIGWTIFHKWK